MRKLLIALLLLAVVLALPLLLMRSERALLFLAHWGVESFTDYHLVLRQPVLKPLRGVLSAAEIHLFPKADDAPPLLSVTDFAAELKVADVYRGDLRNSRVSASQVTVYTSAQDSTADPAPMQWLQYLTWLPQKLDIGQMHVINASREVFIFPLQDLAGQRHKGAIFNLVAKAQYDGEPLDLVLKLAAGHSHARLTSLDVDAAFIAPASGSRVQLVGDLQGTNEAFSYDLRMEADYHQVERFLQGLDGAPPLAGSLNIQAAMRGDTEGFTLSDANFVLNNMPEYGLEAAGTFTYKRSGENQLTLIAAGEIDPASALLDGLPVNIHPLGKAQMNARLSGSLEQLVVDRFLLHSENAAGLSINISGQTEFGSQAATTTQFYLDLKGPQLEVLSHWTGPLPYEPGPFSASAVLRSHGDSLQLDNIILEVGSSSDVSLRLQGSASAKRPLQGRGLAAVNRAEVEVLLKATDSSSLSPYLDIPVPDGFEVSGSLQLAGSATRLLVSGGRIEALSSDISVSLLPEGGQIALTEQPMLRGLAADVSLSISDSSALSQFVSFPVPVLGAIRGSGWLRQRDSLFALENTRLELQSESGTLQLQGGINNLAALRGVSFEGSFSGIGVRDLLLTTLDQLDYAGELGSLQGSFALGRQGEEWQLQRFRLKTEDDDGPLLLDAHGELAKLMTVPQGNLAVQYRLRDPSLLAALTGLRMNPLSGNLQVSSGDGITRVQGEGRAGDTLISLQGQLQHSLEKIDQLTLHLASPLVRLDDLGLQATQAQSDIYKPSEQIELKPLQRLEQALLNAPQYPTDITIDATGIIGENTNINSFDLHFTGEDHRYTLRRFTLDYDSSVTEIRGIIDLNSRPAFASLAGEVSALPLNTLTRDLGMDRDISGKLHMRGGLSAMGTTGEALLASLDGNMAMALEDAEIQGAAYDVLATDLLGWFYSGAVLEKSTRIDCTMAKFLVDDGVASSDSLYIETSKIVATGNARLNLAQQTMKVDFTPLSKSRSLQIPSSIKLRGTFDNPTVTLSPVTAAFDAYAQILTLVPRIAGQIFGIKTNTDKLRPCATNP